MVVHVLVGFGRFAERLNGMDYILTLKAAFGKPLPADVADSSKIPSRMIPVWVATCSCKDDVRDHKVRMFAEVKSALAFFTPCEIGNISAPCQSGDSLM